MGNSQIKFEQKFEQKYEFIQFLKDNNFGLIKVYRKKEPCYDYVMIISKTIDPEQKEKYKDQIEHLQKCFRMEDQPSFLRIFGYQFIECKVSIMIEKIAKCNKAMTVKIYMEYLNYTLKDHILLRAEQGRYFTRDQVMYILSGCLNIYTQYQNLTITNISFRSDCIFITPQGYVKFSAIKIDQNQEDDISCNGIMKCYPSRIVKKFKKNKRQFLFQLKKLLSELIKFQNYVYQEAEQMFKLVKRISSVNTIEQLYKIIETPKVQKLVLGKKDSYQFNQKSQTRIKDSPFGTHSSFSVNSKLSVKNTLKSPIYFQNTRS